MHKTLKNTLILLQLILPQHLMAGQCSESDAIPPFLDAIATPFMTDAEIINPLRHEINGKKILQHEASITLFILGEPEEPCHKQGQLFFPHTEFAANDAFENPINLSVEDISSDHASSFMDSVIDKVMTEHKYADHFKVIDDHSEIFVRKFAAVMAYLHAYDLTYDFSQHKLLCKFNMPVESCTRPWNITIILPEWKHVERLHENNLNVAIYDFFALRNSVCHGSMRNVFSHNYLTYLYEFNPDRYAIIYNAHMAATMEAPSTPAVSEHLTLSS